MNSATKLQHITCHILDYGSFELHITFLLPLFKGINPTCWPEYQISSQLNLSDRIDKINSKKITFDFCECLGRERSVRYHKREVCSNTYPVTKKWLAKTASHISTWDFCVFYFRPFWPILLPKTVTRLKNRHQNCFVTIVN